LADPNVDAVVLATPHSQHEEQIKRAAAAGKHIHVEKPITLDYPTAKSASKRPGRAGVMLAVGFCRRFHPSVGEVPAAAARWPLGKSGPASSPAHHQHLDVHPAENWRADPDEAPAGAMTAVGLHSLDHMIEFAGRVREVQCITARHGSGRPRIRRCWYCGSKAASPGTLFCSVATATSYS